jgi:hypothetical protein
MMAKAVHLCVLVLLAVCLACPGSVYSFDIVKISPLKFPDQFAGINLDVEVIPEGEGAAVFNLTNGEPGLTFTMSIVEPSVLLQNADSSIGIDTFRVLGPQGFDKTGNANNIRVGAVAHIGERNTYGSYSGTATILIVYE